jgi:hypothetical protein
MRRLMRSISCAARERAEGASRQLKYMKYTFELRAESIG